MDIRQPIEYVNHPCFHAADTEACIANMCPTIQHGEPPPVPSGNSLPPVIASMYRIPLLSPAQERHLFCRMNWLRCQAETLRQSVNDCNARQTEILTRIQRLLADALELRNAIVTANLRLAVPVARQFVTPGLTFEDLLSESHGPLIRAAELFDCSKGYRFSTYATNSIRNRFLRVRQQRQQSIRRSATREFVDVEQIVDDSSHPDLREKALMDIDRAVGKLVAELEPRDREIVSLRWGLGESAGPMSLAEIGRSVGLSKERVRQRAIRAVDFLQRAAHDANCDLLLNSA